jgi:hypothetical protein
MSGDRAWTAPEMTPLVDAPDEEDRHAEDRRGVTDRTPGSEVVPEPGEVPGLETRVEGRSRLGTTTGADRTDEGSGQQRDDPAP